MKTDDVAWTKVIISPSSDGERDMGVDGVDAVIRRYMTVEGRGIRVLKRK